MTAVNPFLTWNRIRLDEFIRSTTVELVAKRAGLLTLQGIAKTAVDKTAVLNNAAIAALEGEIKVLEGRLALAQAARVLTSAPTPPPPPAPSGGVVSRTLQRIGRWVFRGRLPPGAGLAGGAVVVLVVGGVIVYVGSTLLGDRMGDKPIVAGPALAGRTPGQPSPLGGSVGGEPGSGGSLPGSGQGGTGLGAPTAPASVDVTSFTGVWVRSDGVTDGVARAVFVQSGSSVAGKVDIQGAIRGEDERILIASGRYDLTGTVNDGTLTFTMDKFKGEVSLNASGNRGMFLSGFMKAPGGRPFGSPFNLQRQVTVPPR